jgi:hypothetical protein
MDIEVLKKAFLETSYIINGEEDIVLKIGIMPEELLSEFPSISTWAFLTAWNPLPEILTQDENRARNIALKDELSAKGFSVRHGVGVSDTEDWSEDSFFIADISLDVARSISSRFGQLAFLFGDRRSGNQLIFT